MSSAPTMVTVTIDDVETSVPQDTLVIRTAEQAGIRIPRSCDHPLLEPIAACRQCLVEVGVPDRSTGELCFVPKPQPSCAQAVAPGMTVGTQSASEVAGKAQRGVVEFLLINHPLDYPICDKGGGCPLRNQAMTDGRATSRFADAKHSYRKPLRLTSQILLDRERCILYQRCVRSGKEISGDVFLDLRGRGGGSTPTNEHYFMAEQIGGFDTATLDFHDSKGKEHSAPEFSSPYDEAGPLGALNCGELTETDRDQSGRASASYFSGNIVQICPVGALTAASYHFRARPFDLMSTASIAEHNVFDSTIRVSTRHDETVRRMAGNEPKVNEEWATDKDRFVFGQERKSYLKTPLVHVDGALAPTSWSDALDVVHKGLEVAEGQVGFLPDGRLTFEDAWVWPKFTHTVTGSDSIDFHSRVLSEEERSFPASKVAGSGPGVSYADLEKAGQVLLVAFEPKDECGVVFLRLRKAVLEDGLKVTSVAPFTSKGSTKPSVKLLRIAPGTKAEVLVSIVEGRQNADLVEALKGGVILVGERAARTPSLSSAALELAERTGARLQQVSRRAGDRGAIEAGLLPDLLPFGRLLDDAASHEQVGWTLPQARGLDASAQLEGAINSNVSALVVGGVDVRDFEDPTDTLRVFEAVPFLVSLEVRTPDTIELADVVLPVATPTEKNGTFIDWEGHLRSFSQAISARSLTDREVFARFAEEFGVDLGVMALTNLHEEANTLMDSSGTHKEFTPLSAPAPAPVDAGQAILATHKPILDAGRLQDGAPWFAGSTRHPIVLASENASVAADVAPGCVPTLTNERGSIELPASAADLPDSVVWVPECLRGSLVRQSLGTAGTLVTPDVTGGVTR